MSRETSKILDDSIVTYFSNLFFRYVRTYLSVFFNPIREAIEISWKIPLVFCFLFYLYDLIHVEDLHFDRRKLQRNLLILHFTLSFVASSRLNKFSTFSSIFSNIFGVKV